MNGPRTSREALIAEVLGEVDALLVRVEALPQAVAGAEARIVAAVLALRDAGDKYRVAVTAFTEDAKVELTQYLERRATAITSNTAEEQRAAMQETARQAFQVAACENAATLANASEAAVKAFRGSRWSRLIEHAITAVLASGITVAFIHAIVTRH
jgi:hypothetical protein